MKRNFLIVFSFLFILTSCSLDNENNNDEEQQVILSFWHLRDTSGGFAGVSDQFELDTVVWFFDETNGTITIENNNTDDTKQDAFDSGTYTYSIITDDTDQFIIIDGNELGEITVDLTDFIIDENNTSNGLVADGFVYSFQRVNEVQ